MFCHPKWEQNHPKLCENRFVVSENDNPVRTGTTIRNKR